MSEILLLNFIHLLLFVYWLGGDLGTFYASRFVARADLTVAQRSTALNIMLGVDQGPRLCMPLILPSGLHLGAVLGMIQLPASMVLLVWLIGLFWFAMVLVLHFVKGKPWLAGLGRFDFVFRCVVIGLCLLLAATVLLAEPWLTARMAVKLTVFAGLVGCGLGIRLALKPFMQAWQQMIQHGIQPQSDRSMQQALAKARWYVYTIWLGLLINAAIGTHLIQL
ncbi:hypothetical protein [Alkalimonas sp.]|uniref:hypothetical protein n=1 Tax=Alkalimonas sp. TaxID=1872453 RepID=UPI00263BDC2E|nr:hypothetical protein [Alkalimonas sp.]MCC5825025.1 hypothetical protein [Alkalimonas sp.]